MYQALHNTILRRQKLHSVQNFRKKTVRKRGNTGKHGVASVQLKISMVCVCFLNTPRLSTFYVIVKNIEQFHWSVKRHSWEKPWPL